MDSEIKRPIWQTGLKRCDVVFSPLRGYAVRLWVDGQLLVDEAMPDAESAIDRAWGLHSERARLGE
jgi:hypothetical protein